MEILVTRGGGRLGHSTQLHVPTHTHVRTKLENKLLTAKLSTLDHANVCLVMEHFTNKIKYACYLSVYPDPPHVDSNGPTHMYMY